MLRIVFSRIISFITLLLCFSSCSIEQEEHLPYYNAANFTPQFLSITEAKKQITHSLPHFSLTTEQNITLTDSALHGKIHIANFIFTHCGSICPKMTTNMNLVSTAFKEDSSIILLSYTVTPWIDIPKELRHYKETKTNNNKNWHFLTGAKGNIYKLARQGYFAEEALGFTKDSSEFLHTEHFILVDKNAQIRGIYNGTLTLEIEQLIADIRLLKLEL